MPEPMLALAGVNTHIGQYHILQGVDFEVPRGGLTMLLGRNGAGKTTCLRTIMGLWRASAGRIRYEEADIQDLKTPAIARLGVAYVPENMGIFAGLTVRENMLLAARGGAPDLKRLGWIFGLFPALEKFWDGAAGNLSGGQKQMLAVARAIVEPRRLLLVDEPTKGLAPAIVANMIDTVIAARLKPALRSLPLTVPARSGYRFEQPAEDAGAGAEAQPKRDDRVDAKALAVMADGENQLQQQQD